MGMVAAARKMMTVPNGSLVRIRSGQERAGEDGYVENLIHDGATQRHYSIALIHGGYHTYPETAFDLLVPESGTSSVDAPGISPIGGLVDAAMEKIARAEAGSDALTKKEAKALLVELLADLAEIRSKL